LDATFGPGWIAVEVGFNPIGSVCEENESAVATESRIDEEWVRFAVV